MKKAIVYACSHRRGGNSDHAAECLARGVREAGGDVDVMYVRDYTVMPCLSCGVCDKSVDTQGRERCVLGKKDQAWELFQPMLTARTILFASPIYFYHLPSMFKTWIDRSQQFWTASMTQEPWIADLPKRTAHSVLMAGRPTGEKLFEGAEVTLKYFTWNFNVGLAEPLVFRGIDNPGDLADKTTFEDAIIAHGKRAWEEAV